jgi:hypothetical protein
LTHLSRLRRETLRDALRRMVLRGALRGPSEGEQAL